MIRQDIIDRIISDVSILEVAENGGVSFTKKAGQDIGLVVHSIMRMGLLSMSIQPLIRGAASDAIPVAMSSLFTEN